MVYETFVLPNGDKLTNVHAREDCAGRACVIHNPSEHRMRGWPLSWRNDRAMFERTCEHGVGHPDPDQFDYWLEVSLTTQAVHGCDGCCGVVQEVKIVPVNEVFYVTMEGTPDLDHDVWFESSGEATHYAISVYPWALLCYEQPLRAGWWNRFLQRTGVRR